MSRFESPPDGPSGRPPSEPRFVADQIRIGEPYELSEGRKIECFPTGGRGSLANADGAGILGSDPDVEDAGVDPGFSPEPGTLRAPDVAVGVSDEAGWTRGAPPLAIEYADRGQDENDLERKIRELLRAGTRYLWVVRMNGPRRVEIHQPKKPVRLAHPGDELTAPGILRNPVPVAALYSRTAARDVILRNLLQRKGYEDLEAVLEKGFREGLEQGREEGREEGRERGREEGRAKGKLEERRVALLELCEVRGLSLSAEQRLQIERCDDPDTLKTWFRRAGTADDPAGLL